MLLTSLLKVIILSSTSHGQNSIFSTIPLRRLARRIIDEDEFNTNIMLTASHRPAFYESYVYNPDRHDARSVFLSTNWNSLPANTFHGSESKNSNKVAGKVVGNSLSNRKSSQKLLRNSSEDLQEPNDKERSISLLNSGKLRRHPQDLIKAAFQKEYESVRTKDALGEINRSAAAQATEDVNRNLPASGNKTDIKSSNETKFNNSKPLRRSPESDIYDLPNLDMRKIMTIRLNNGKVNYADKKRRITDATDARQKEPLIKTPDNRTSKKWTPEPTSQKYDSNHQKTHHYDKKINENKNSNETGKEINKTHDIQQRQGLNSDSNQSGLERETNYFTMHFRGNRSNNEPERTKIINDEDEIVELNNEDDISRKKTNDNQNEDQNEELENDEQDEIQESLSEDHESDYQVQKNNPASIFYDEAHDGSLNEDYKDERYEYKNDIEEDEMEDGEYEDEETEEENAEKEKSEIKRQEEVPWWKVIDASHDIWKPFVNSI